MKLSEDYTTNIDAFILKLDTEYELKYQFRKNGGCYYYNIPASFDIETSSFFNNGKKQSIMYIWQFCFNGDCVIGRTWEDFLLLVYKLCKKLDISTEKRLLVYVHNLSYEFQFMRKYFNWVEFFAIDERTPIKICSENGIEFRDSYILSGYNLKKTGEQLHKYNIKKLTGDLDYDKIRTPKTELTDTEMMYCVHDVLVVVAYIQEQIEQYDNNITRIPLTNTGRVRTFCRNSCFNGFSGNKKENKEKYKNLMRSLTLEVDEYKLLKRCFMGGFTHTNFTHVGDLITDVTSYDFTSSYPYVMLSEKFPMGKGFRHPIKDINEYTDLEKCYCMVFDMELIGVSPKLWDEQPLSESKCWKIENPIVNNGRIVYADRVITSGTNIDLDIYRKFYNIEHCKIYNCYCYYKDYLPKNFLLSILKLYNDKTTLKGVSGKEVEYLHSKGMLNSCYGMTVTDIAKDNILYNSDDTYRKEPVNLNDEIAKYNSSKNRFLFYPWGIFVTAYARRNLFTAIINCGSDYIYSDTDSVKIINADRHIKYFEKYNKLVALKLQAVCNHYQLDNALFSPKTINGVKKPIGIWDFDGHYQYFKALRAKCYLYTDDSGELHATVAGCGKNNISEFLKKEYKTTDSIYEHFKNGLIVPANVTGKMTHTYIDDMVCGTITDYKGESYEYQELSGIHLSKAQFEISISSEFEHFLKGYKYNYVF